MRGILDRTTLRPELGHQRACCLITVAEYAFTESVLAFNHSAGVSRIPGVRPEITEADHH